MEADTMSSALFTSYDDINLSGAGTSFAEMINTENLLASDRRTRTLSSSSASSFGRARTLSCSSVSSLGVSGVISGLWDVGSTAPGSWPPLVTDLMHFNGECGVLFSSVDDIEYSQELDFPHALFQPNTFLHATETYADELIPASSSESHSKHEKSDDIITKCQQHSKSVANLKSNVAIKLQNTREIECKGATKKEPEESLHVVNVHDLECTLPFNISEQPLNEQFLMEVLGKKSLKSEQRLADCPVKKSPTREEDSQYVSAKTNNISGDQIKDPLTGTAITKLQTSDRLKVKIQPDIGSNMDIVICEKNNNGREHERDLFCGTKSYGKGVLSSGRIERGLGMASKGIRVVKSLSSTCVAFSNSVDSMQNVVATGTLRRSSRTVSSAVTDNTTASQNLHSSANRSVMPVVKVEQDINGIIADDVCSLLDKFEEEAHFLDIGNLKATMSCEDFEISTVSAENDGTCHQELNVLSIEDNSSNILYTLLSADSQSHNNSPNWVYEADDVLNISSVDVVGFEECCTDLTAVDCDTLNDCFEDISTEFESFGAQPNTNEQLVSCPGVIQQACRSMLRPEMLFVNEQSLSEEVVLEQQDDKGCVADAKIKAGILNQKATSSNLSGSATELKLSTSLTPVVKIEKMSSLSKDRERIMREKARAISLAIVDKKQNDANNDTNTTKMEASDNAKSLMQTAFNHKNEQERDQILHCKKTCATGRSACSPMIATNGTKAETLTNMAKEPHKADAKKRAIPSKDLKRVIGRNQVLPSMIKNDPSRLVPSSISTIASGCKSATSISPVTSSNKPVASSATFATSSCGTGKRTDVCSVIASTGKSSEMVSLLKPISAIISSNSPSKSTVTSISDSACSSVPAFSATMSSSQSICSFAVKPCASASVQALKCDPSKTSSSSKCHSRVSISSVEIPTSTHVLKFSIEVENSTDPVEMAQCDVPATKQHTTPPPTKKRKLNLAEYRRELPLRRKLKLAASDIDSGAVGDLMEEAEGGVVGFVTVIEAADKGCLPINQWSPFRPRRTATEDTGGPAVRALWDDIAMSPQLGQGKAFVNGRDEHIHFNFEPTLDHNYCNHPLISSEGITSNICDLSANQMSTKKTNDVNQTAIGFHSEPVYNIDVVNTDRDRGKRSLEVPNERTHSYEPMSDNHVTVIVSSKPSYECTSTKMPDVEHVLPPFFNPFVPPPSHVIKPEVIQEVVFDPSIPPPPISTPSMVSALCVPLPVPPPSFTAPPPSLFSTTFLSLPLQTSVPNLLPPLLSFPCTVPPPPPPPPSLPTLVPSPLLPHASISLPSSLSPSICPASCSTSRTSIPPPLSDLSPVLSQRQSPSPISSASSFTVLSTVSTSVALCTPSLPPTSPPLPPSTFPLLPSVSPPLPPSCSPPLPHSTSPYLLPSASPPLPPSSSPPLPPSSSPPLPPSASPSLPSSISPHLPPYTSSSLPPSASHNLLSPTVVVSKIQAVTQSLPCDKSEKPLPLTASESPDANCSNTVSNKCVRPLNNKERCTDAHSSVTHMDVIPSSSSMLSSVPEAIRASTSTGNCLLSIAIDHSYSSCSAVCESLSRNTGRISMRQFRRKSSSSSSSGSSKSSVSSSLSNRRSSSRSRSRSWSPGRRQARSNSRSSSVRRSRSRSVSSRRNWSHRSRSREMRSRRSRSRATISRRSTKSRSSSRSRRSGRSRSRASVSPTGSWRRWEVDQKIRRQRECRPSQAERRTVYVGCIPPDFTKGDLERKFRKFGEIVKTSVHFREEGDDYGFVTFVYKCDAYACIERGNTLPGCKDFVFSFGGRRQFCGSGYTDLDGKMEYEEEMSSAQKSPNSMGFDDLLRQVKKQLKKGV